jgi:polyisoprenyl-teichoic acid--peptidoglycan teichoic acid transferase
MAPSGEKPYRVYKGGRQKGKVPSPGGRGSRRPQAEEQPDRRGRQVKRRPQREFSRGRAVLWSLVAVIVLLVVWAALGYLSVHGGVSDANARLQTAAPGVDTTVKPVGGLMISKPANILLIGTDHSENGQPGRSSDQHSDSLMLLHTDPGSHRLVYLSLPRDLRASIPGYGSSKINAAMQLGGPKLTIRTVDEFTGLDINHVVVVDFGSFVKLIDAVGGIDVNVPENILSNRFDCPYATATRCQQWQGWRFHKGVTHMNGHTALIYSRIRENRLNPADTDISRGLHQQQVMQATLSKIAGAGTFFRLPFSGGDLMKPLSTDLSTSDFLQLAWLKLRAATTLHCRLGGRDLGDGYLQPSENNRLVMQEVLGNSAPQPPNPADGPFGPGCLIGNAAFSQTK